MLYDRPTPISDALRSVQARAVLPTALSSIEIAAHVPAQIRDIAFISARTTYAGYLADFKREVETLVNPGDSTATRTNPLELRARMRNRLLSLGYEPDPDKRGSIEDLSSDRRINLVIQMQEGMTHGYGHWRSGQDPAIRDMWPADEFYRAEERKEPRNWLQRWIAQRAAAGATTRSTIAGPPFAALKDDPIFTLLSAFGVPHRPFDYNSGMALRDMRRDKAEAEGLISPGEPAPAPRADPLQQIARASVAELDPAMQAALLQTFGARAAIVDGQIAVLPDPAAAIGYVLDAAARQVAADAPFAWLPAAAEPAAARALGRAALPAGTALCVDSAAIRRMAWDGTAPQDLVKLGARGALEGAWRTLAPSDPDVFRGLADIILTLQDGTLTGWKFGEALRRLTLVALRRSAGL